MFDKKDIEAYRSIVVPSGLKQRIERDCVKKPRVIGGSRLTRFALPMAACLVLLCTVFAYLPGFDGDAVLSYDGTRVTEQGIVVGNGHGRSTPVLYSEEEGVAVTLSVKARSDCSLSVSTGTLILLQSETVLSANEETEIRGECEILWELSRDSAEPFELYLRTGDDVCTYVLEYDEALGGYVICQK